MAAKKKVYWLGELVGKRRVGRIKVDGKNVKIGESFAADGLSKDRLSMFRKAGCIGDAPFHIPESAGDDITLLQGRLKEMEDAAKIDGDKIAGLELELEAVGDATELKSEVERLTGEAKEAADLKAAHVKAHADKAAAGKDADKTEKKDGKK